MYLCVFNDNKRLNTRQKIFRPVALEPVNAPSMSVRLSRIRNAAQQYKVS